MQGPLLNSIWMYPVAYSLAAFIIYQALLRHNQLYSDNPICDYPGFSYTANCANLLQGGGFVVVFFVLITNYFTLNHDVNLFGSLITTLCVSLLAGAAAFMSIFWNWGGICEDGFGVRSPAVMWGEWITCVPLIFLIVIATECKPSLSITDTVILINVFLSMVLAGMMNFRFDIGVHIALVIMSTCCIIIALALLVKSSPYRNVVLCELIQDSVKTNLFLKKRELTINLLIIIPTFPIIYFLCASKLINNNVYAVLLIICNSLTKILFMTQVMGAHVQIISIMHSAEIQSNQARQAFLRFIMHEVRIPLNSLAMGINILSTSSNLNDEDKDALVTMESAAGFMRETLNDILSIQKIEEGRLELTYSPFSIREILLKVKSTLQGMLSEKHISLVVTIADDVPKGLVGDAFRIQHVITNLVCNAIQFSFPDSEVRITISTASQCNILNGENQDPSCILIVAITDHGTGISEVDQKKLFQSFMQIRPGESQGGGGSSGIGLSLCKQFIELHGGIIECQSVLGQGSTFTFKLPLKIGTVVEVEEELRQTVCTNKRKPAVVAVTVTSPRDRLPSTTTTNYLPKSFHISTFSRIVSFDNEDTETICNQDHPNLTYKALITDDVPSNSKLLRMLLKKRGYESIIAHNGKEAVEIVKKSFDDFDLIFMDNMMPIMNGLQATRELRAMGYRKLILGLTGNALDDDVDEFLAAGANKVFLKPLQSDHLDALLADIRKYGPQFMIKS